MNVLSREQSSAFLGALCGSSLPLCWEQTAEDAEDGNSEPATRFGLATVGGWMWRPRFD
jgi:hypothetical protein